MGNRLVLTIGLIFILLGVLGAAIKIDVERVEASPTIYIRANGLVEGTDKITTLDNVTYTFIGDINDSIVVERGNIIINGNGHTLQGSGSGNGFYWVDINNVTLRNTDIRNFANGVHISYSNNSIVSGNTITNSSYDGVILSWSNYTTVSGNTITNNGSGVGVELFWSCTKNTVSENTITDSIHAVYLSTDSDNNTVSGNTMTNNGGGVYGGSLLLSSSDNNTFFGNTIKNSTTYCVYLDRSDNNTIYHNNFINNPYQALAANSLNNTWDDGYPSGGNFWSDYSGVDLYSGPAQNVTGSDGIGDTPYEIDYYDYDHYPLMSQYVIAEFPSFLILPLFMIATLVAVTVYKKKRTEWSNNVARTR